MIIKLNLGKCLGENTKQYKTFTVEIGKEIKKTGKEGNEDITNVSYRIKFMENTKFRTCSLSNLANKLTE